MQIIILGRECPECDMLDQNVRQAVTLLGIEDAEIEHIDDIRQEVEVFGVEKVPALVVDGTIVMQGDNPTVDDIVRMIEDAEYIA